MNRRLTSSCVSLAACFVLASGVAAQDLAITNARIIVGSGQVIDSGTIVVRDGKIATVTGGSVQIPKGLQVIDAKGMSAMPGFIDGHKHLADGPTGKAWMQSLLEAGYTTVLIGGGPADANLALAKKIESGEYNGPRAIPSGAVVLRQTPAEARAAVQALAKMGIKHTGEIALTPEPAPPQAEIETLKAIVDEAKKVGIQVNVHAVSSPAMVAAIDAGVTRLVHLPNKDWTSYEQADAVAKAGAIVAGLIAFGAPNVDTLSQGAAPVQWPKDNTPRFRDGRPWPESIAGANRDAKGRATGTEGGYTIVNARRIWDADPNHTTISYSTDQNADDLVVLEHELKSFSIVFSMADIHRIIGPNAARFVGMADQIGTLEAGKLADIILLDGDATKNVYEMLKTKVVLKQGKIVVDKRPPPPAAATARPARSTR
ncbi:MAG TPA: amidohydrolase family protein [Vicinamibacterales bacterium]|jgi:imidazolonepropionase-like amidohydrolase|nr:amidohydrolase family protein [Vicinamibacterales bacterium]